MGWWKRFKRTVTAIATSIENKLASVAFENGEFLYNSLKKNLEVLDLTHTETSNLRLEAHVLALISISFGLQSCPSKKLPQSILDDVHQAYYEKFADSFNLDILELYAFEQLLREKYDSYYRVLLGSEIKNGIPEIKDGVTSKLSRQFFINAFGEARSYALEKSPAAFVLVPSLFFHWVSFIEEYVNKLEGT